MAVKDEKKEINGRLFLVEQMPAMTSFKNQLKILKILGTGIKELKGDLEKIGSEVILNSLGNAISDLDVDQSSDLIFGAKVAIDSS